MSLDTIELHWSDCIVMFNSLVESIEQLRNAIENGELDDDELYDAEENLNDYMVLLARLKKKYEACSDRGELPKALAVKLRHL